MESLEIFDTERQKWFKVKLIALELTAGPLVSFFSFCWQVGIHLSTGSIKSSKSLIKEVICNTFYQKLKINVRKQSRNLNTKSTPKNQSISSLHREDIHLKSKAWSKSCWTRIKKFRTKNSRSHCASPWNLQCKPNGGNQTWKLLVTPQSKQSYLN